MSINKSSASYIRFNRLKEDLVAIGVPKKLIPKILLRAHRLVDEWSGFHYRHISSSAYDVVQAINKDYEAQI